MGNIWDFLLYTLTVSMTAAFLLLIKRIFLYKLSPRWQYGIWSLFFLCMIVPVPVSRSLLLPIPLWCELLKTFAEAGLNSSFSSAFLPVQSSFCIPVIRGVPVSLTDWLFLLYIAGVLGSLLSYGLSFLRLRRLIHSCGQPAGPLLTRQIHALSDRYGLPSCRAVVIEGLPSAFICGCLRPVLVLPAGASPDDAVLLHELLHLKHHDCLQNILWSLFRALHWCNPFLRAVFRRISHDQETLCDYRVLERLRGEARREYGRLLLSMANQTCASVPGTTSLSNGPSGISRRIASIARFKQYPKDMALVSACIAVLLLLPCLTGTPFIAESPGAALPLPALLQPSPDYLQAADGNPDTAMALTRLNRCTTAAGALDTYAKGILTGSTLYLATAMPLSFQEALYTHGAPADAVLEGSFRNPAYYVYNPSRLDNETYLAYIIIPLLSLNDGVLQEATPCTEELLSSGRDLGYAAIFPVRLTCAKSLTGSQWTVRPEGPPRYQLVEAGQADSPWGCADIYLENGATVLSGATGSVLLQTQLIGAVDNEAQERSPLTFPFADSRFDFSLKTDAVFAGWNRCDYSTYCFEGTGEQQNALRSVSLLTLYDPSPETLARLSASDTANASVPETYTLTDGYVHCIIDESWDGYVHCGGGSGLYDGSGRDALPTVPAERLAAAVYFNGTLAELFISGEDIP